MGRELAMRGRQPLSRATLEGASLPLIVRTRDGALRAAFAAVPLAEAVALEAASEAILHPDERRYLASIPAWRRRASFVTGRYAAKLALARVLGEVEFAELAIAAGVFEQPVLSRWAGSPVEVGITHSEDLACSVAFPSALPMAVDTEPIEESRAETMRTQILDEELEEVRRHGLDGAAACALVWTAKEALSKALRCGMTCPFELLAIERLERGSTPYSGTFRNFGQYRFYGWRAGRSFVTIVLPKVCRLETDLGPLLAGLELP